MLRRDKCRLSESNAKVLLVETNRLIVETANELARSLKDQGQAPSPMFPPNGGLTQTEQEELHVFRDNEKLCSAMRKLLADNAAAVVFHILNLLDQTGDPQMAEWQGEGVALVDLEDGAELPELMLHDELFDSYWDWRSRADSTLRIDNLDQ